MIVPPSQTVKSVNIYNICINKHINFLIELITAIAIIWFFDGVVKCIIMRWYVFFFFHFEIFKLKTEQEFFAILNNFFSAAENMINLFVGGNMVEIKQFCGILLHMEKWFKLSVGGELTLYWRQGHYPASQVHRPFLIC